MKRDVRGKRVSSPAIRNITLPVTGAKAYSRRSTFITLKPYSTILKKTVQLNGKKQRTDKINVKKSDKER